MTQTMQRKLILVSNDDGYQAKGLHELLLALAPFGEVVAVAPDQPQSSTSHALTMRDPLRVTLREQCPEYTLYSCSGHPADCIKFAMHETVKRAPDLLVAGINHGENASCSALYSGTVAIAMEGCMYHVPGIAFSLINQSPEADFSACLPVVRQVVEKVLQDGLPDGVCLNVNIPDLPAGALRGIRLCRLAKGYWHEMFDRRTDPYGRVYYWLDGRFINEEPDADDTDQWALAHGYVSVVPTHADLSARETLEDLRRTWGGLL